MFIMQKSSSFWGFSFKLKFFFLFFVCVGNNKHTHIPTLALLKFDNVHFSDYIFFKLLLLIKRGKVFPKKEKNWYSTYANENPSQQHVHSFLFFSFFFLIFWQQTQRWVHLGNCDIEKVYPLFLITVKIFQWKLWLLCRLHKHNFNTTLVCFLFSSLFVVLQDSINWIFHSVM